MVLSCLPLSAVQAQGASGGSLPEVVVSGAGDHELADELPLSFDVVGSDNWTDRQNETLGRALQDLPNASVRSTPARLAVGAASSAFARDGNTGINIRGLGGNRVLMTVDGVRMPRSYVSRSAIFDREYLSLELYKRIELIRGPGSALYGSDGMAGVVNFVTWDPWDFLRSAEGGPAKAIGGRVSTGWSQEDRGYSLAATVAGQASDSARWLLTAAGRRAHGLETRGSNREPNANRTVPNPERDRDQAVLGKLVLTPSAAQRHVLSFEHTQRKSDIELLSSRAPVPVRPNDVLDEQTAYSGQRDRLAWDGQFELQGAWADSVRALLAWQRSSSHRVGTSDLFSGVHRVRDNRYDEHAWQAGLRADKLVRTGEAAHRITYGFDYVRNRITNLYDGVAPIPPETFPLKRFPDTRETASALYLQGESILGDWTFTPGLRLDHFSIDVTSQDGYYPPASQPGRSLSGSALSPKLGVQYRITPAWSIHGQFATGYRPPEAGQLNDHFEAIAPSPVGPPIHVLIQPNPNLKPEKSRGFEIGLRGRMERLSLDLALFSNRYRNLIVDAEFIEQVGFERLFQAVNIPRARIHGVELKGRYDWGRVAGGQLATTFAWGMARGTDRSTGKPLNSIDPAQLSVGLRYDAQQWSLWADARHHRAKKASDIDSASIMNARDGIQFAPPSATTLDVGLQWRPRKDVRLNLGVRNLTNRKYWLWPSVYGVAGTSPVRDAYTQPGRSAYFSLVVDF